VVREVLLAHEVPIEEFDRGQVALAIGGRPPGPRPAVGVAAHPTPLAGQPRRMGVRAARPFQMSHEEPHVFGAAAVEVDALCAGQVLAEVDQVVAVAPHRPVVDPGVVDFDRLGDQLVVREFHPLLLDLVEETGRRRVDRAVQDWHRTLCPIGHIHVSGRFSNLPFRLLVKDRGTGLSGSMRESERGFDPRRPLRFWPCSANQEGRSQPHFSPILGLRVASTWFWCVLREVEGSTSKCGRSTCWAGSLGRPRGPHGGETDSRSRRSTTRHGLA